MNVELATITVKYQQYSQPSIHLDATEDLQNWHNPENTYQAVNSVQNFQTFDEDIYLNTVSSSGFNTPSDSSSENKFSTGD